MFKKEDASLLKNYRPVSVLPVRSKIHERIMQKQILKYIDKHLFPTYVDIEKGTVCKQLYMHEKLKLSKDNKGFPGGVLMDLSKHLIQYITSYCWQNCMLMDSANGL